MLALGSLNATNATLRTGQDELRTAKEGQITDRYTKAVEQLGSDTPEVRLGGIYALERLMSDSARDRRTILEVLTSYVRVHSQDPPSTGSDKTRLAVDVRAALTVIGRRDRTDEKDFSLDSLDLISADFHGKNLTGARLDGADLTGADLTGAKLDGAKLDGADLTGAFLRDTHLTGANLNGAKLDGANLNGAFWSGGTTWPASLGGAAGMRVRSEPGEFSDDFWRVRSDDSARLPPATRTTRSPAPAGP